ncbi:MAG: pitrilysin family protein [archaeon]
MAFEKPKFFRKILENGMTVILEKRDLPVVSLGFALKAGAIHESLKEKGISHFIEHMLYKGTKKRSAKDIANELEKRGADVNGFTSEEVTAYWCKIPSKHIEIALDVLSDMIKNSVFDEKEVEKERKVIFEEIKMYHDNPQAYTFKEITKMLYDGSFQIDISGTFETMNSLSQEDLIKRFKKVYNPKNLILCAVGDCDFDSLVEFAKKNFEKGNGEEPAKPSFNKKNQIKIEKREGLDQANLIFAYHTPVFKEKKSSVAEVLNCLMADGMSSRLFSEIREKRNLAYAVKGGCESVKHFAYNLVYVGTTKENVEAVKKIILEEFNKVSKSLTQKELDEVKEQLISQYEISMENSQNQLFALIIHEAINNAKDFYDFEKNISAVSLEEIKELATMAAKEYSFFALVPE